VEVEAGMRGARAMLVQCLCDAAPFVRGDRGSGIEGLSMLGMHGKTGSGRRAETTFRSLIRVSAPTPSLLLEDERLSRVLWKETLRSVLLYPLEWRLVQL